MSIFKKHPLIKKKIYFLVALLFFQLFRNIKKQHHIAMTHIFVTFNQTDGVKLSILISVRCWEGKIEKANFDRKQKEH